MRALRCGVVVGVELNFSGEADALSDIAKNQGIIVFEKTKDGSMYS